MWRSSGRLSITHPTRRTTQPELKSGWVLLVATRGSYRIAPYLQAAQSLGMHVLVASNSQHSLVPAVARGVTIDFEQLEKAFDTLVLAVRGLKIYCVLATDDSCVELCSRIAEYLQLPQNSPQAAALTQRKDLGRKALREAHCNIPEFQVIHLEAVAQQAVHVRYPVVVKPLALSASRGVIRADNAAQLIAACQRIDAILESSGQSGYIRDNILVESYLDGMEYAVEGLLIHGVFHLLAIFDKPEPLTGPYFEESYYLTPSQLKAEQKSALIDQVRQCCHAYGLQQGPVHAEARITESGVFLLEIAARTIGGQCGQIIQFSLQQNLEKLVILGMCGIKPEVPELVRAAGVLMIPVTDCGILKRVEGLTAALEVNYIEDIEIHIREGYSLTPLPEGASYLGFIFAQGPDYAQVYQALKAAYRALNFITQPNWTLTSLH